MRKLHVAGTRIVDEFGVPVALQGWNGVGKWYHKRRDEPWWLVEPPPLGVEIGERGDDLPWMKDKGFNCIRVNLYWESLEPTLGTYDAESFGYLDEFLNACEAHGVYVWLDMHQWWWSEHWTSPGGWAGRGFPVWAVNGYPATQEGMRDFCLDFYHNRAPASATRTAFLNLWSFIAGRYSGRKVVAGYGLLNEPWQFSKVGMTEPIYAQFIPQYCDMMMSIGGAIRAVDPNTILAAEMKGYDWNELSVTKKQTLPNFVWEFHFYSPAETVYGTVSEGLSIYYDKAIEFGTPLIMTETWSEGMSEALLNEILTNWGIIAGSQAHWSIWRYAKTDGSELWTPRYDYGNLPIKDRAWLQTLYPHIFIPTPTPPIIQIGAPIATGLILTLASLS